MTILQLPACPACGSESYLTFELGGGNRLRRCSECGTVSALDYVDPAEIYVDGYMFGEVGRFGLDAMVPSFQVYLARVAERRIGMIERSTGVSRGSLLDVGSGTGEVMAAARDHGWQTIGVDPERTGAEVARGRGLEVHVALLEEAGLPERSFDVVSAFHVLEHMPDSRGFLRTMARWARPGGHIVIEVPNWTSSQRRRHNENWSGLRPGEHLVHFTPDTLARTMRAAGIEPVAVRSPSYLMPPQTFEQALHDLARYGRIRRLVSPLSHPNGSDGHSPTRAGWALLRGLERIYDRAGVGAVVFCVGRVG
jgi:2-polyprenyl-3-methyl-5-hydroxy-6-metoxy-1,4-benzoquinol methylase